jgi:hypothetical protein
VTTASRAPKVSSAHASTEEAGSGSNRAAAASTSGKVEVVIGVHP